MFSFNQDMRPVLFLLGVDVASFVVVEEIPEPDSASSPFAFLLHAFAA